MRSGYLPSRVDWRLQSIMFALEGHALMENRGTFGAMFSFCVCGTGYDPAAGGRWHMFQIIECDGEFGAGEHFSS